jgi:hypothetical protein
LGAAFDQFKDKELCSARLLQPTNGGNTRMIERREQFGFLLEARHTVGILCEFIRQNLDRNIPPKDLVFGSLGSIGCRFGFESSYEASDVPPSITPLTADRMNSVDLNVHDLIAGVFYSRILSPDMAL